MPISSPTTFKFVFYESLPVGGSRGFILTDVGTNIPLDANASVYLFETKNYATIGNFCLPTPMMNGRTIKIIDAKGLMRVCSIVLSCNVASNTVEGVVLKGYGTNWLVRSLLCLGDGNIGNCLCTIY